MPCREKIVLRASMMLLEVVDLRGEGSNFFFGGFGEKKS